MGDENMIINFLTSEFKQFTFWGRGRQGCTGNIEKH